MGPFDVPFHVDVLSIRGSVLQFLVVGLIPDATDNMEMDVGAALSKRIDNLYQLQLLLGRMDATDRDNPLLLIRPIWWSKRVELNRGITDLGVLILLT
jgi:hypothetical protein